MNLIIKILLITSTIFLAIAFLGGEPSSARGFYYVIWLMIAWYIWRKKEIVSTYLQKIPLPDGVKFIGLGLLMILVEETIAGAMVNLIRTENIGELLRSVPQFYANNLLLLSGFIIAWYILLSRYVYSEKEVFIFIGLFGLFSEKIYLHILGFPIMGIALILPTFFTYMAILNPSILSLRSHGTRILPRPLRYIVNLIFPILISLPFLYIHTKLSELGYIDPSVLTR